MLNRTDTFSPPERNDPTPPTLALLYSAAGGDRSRQHHPWNPTS
jgi:hypothetical protein